MGEDFGRAVKGFKDGVKGDEAPASAEQKADSH
jgi:Sec-independent protein translocase protein TatA